MVLRADRTIQTKIAFEHELLGDSWPTNEAELGADHTLVHLGASGERRLLAVLHEGGAQRGADLQHLPHEVGVGDPVAIVGECRSPRGEHRMHRRDGFALPSEGRRRGDQDPAGRHFPGLHGHPFDHVRRVQRRRGVRHAAEGGEATGDGGPTTSLDGLFPALARLTEMDMGINQTRAHQKAVDVDAMSVTGVNLARTRLDGDDSAISDQDVGGGVEPATGIKHASAGQEGRV